MTKLKYTSSSFGDKILQLYFRQTLFHASNFGKKLGECLFHVINYVVVGHLTDSSTELTSNIVENFYDELEQRLWARSCPALVCDLTNALLERFSISKTHSSANESHEGVKSSTLFFFAYCRLFNTDYMRVNFMFMLPPALLCLFVVLQLSQKDANRLMTWETIQKEDFLTAQNKIQKSSDSQRLKRMSVKWVYRLLIMMTMIYYYHHLNFSFSL